jgi:hypothetical protein
MNEGISLIRAGLVCPLRHPMVAICRLIGSFSALNLVICPKTGSLSPTLAFC